MLRAVAKPASKQRIRQTADAAPAKLPSARSHASCLSIQQAEGLVRERLTQADFRPHARVEAAVTAARYYDRESWFVGTVNYLRKCFFNDGLRFKLEKADDSGDATREDPVAEAWLEEHEAALSNFVADAWESWIVTDNVVANWEFNLCCLKVEQCEYRNELGLPLLYYAHQIHDQDLRQYVKDELLTEQQRARLQQNPRLLVPRDQYRVLARTSAGWGFAWPGVTRIKRAMTSLDSLEVGDIHNAWVTRYVWELHKLGHAITNGPHAGLPTHFWKKKRSDEFSNLIKDKDGHMRHSVNFDHEIEFPYPDMARFDPKKYDNVLMRLAWWSMPFGHAILKGNLLPFYDILRAVVSAERQLMGTFLESVLNQPGAAGLPAGYAIEVAWSKRLLRDQRLAADLLKVGLTAGLSQETFLEELGADPTEERQRKAEEVELDPKITAPTYDPNHGPGTVPGDNGAGAGIQGGRPGGTPDPA